MAALRRRQSVASTTAEWYGCGCLAVAVWLLLFGCGCLDVAAWMLLLGCCCLAVAVWQEQPSSRLKWRLLAMAYFGGSGLGCCSPRSGFAYGCLVVAHLDRICLWLAVARLAVAFLAIRCNLDWQLLDQQLF